MRQAPGRATRRRAAALALVLGAFAWLPVTSAQAGIANSEFIVQPFGGKSVVLEYSVLAGLSPDVVNQSYEVITKLGGKPHKITVSSGYSLEEILDAAGMQPLSFSYVELTLGAAQSALLTAAQATTPPASADFPVFFESDGHLAFADANPADYLSGLGVFYVNLFPGPRLSVKIKASPSSLPAGQRVRLSATVKGAQPGESLSYQWDQGAGLTYGGGNPLALPLETTGTYYAYATAVGSKGSVGISPVISFRVTKAPKGRKGKGKAASAA